MPAALKKIGKTDLAEPDRAQKIFDKLGMKNGKLPDGFEVFGNRLIVATNESPEKSEGGILYTQQRQSEEKNQGKACLVVAKGPTAFKSDANYDFVGQTVEVGDWICLHVYESRPVKINKYECRIIRDQDVVMKIPAPDVIF